MAGLKKTLEGITGLLKMFFEFGIALILLFVVIDILFPETTGVVKNIGELVANLSEKGIVGVIALLMFLWIFNRK